MSLTKIINKTKEIVKNNAKPILIGITALYFGGCATVNQYAPQNEIESKKSFDSETIAIISNNIGESVQIYTDQFMDGQNRSIRQKVLTYKTGDGKDKESYNLISNNGDNLVDAKVITKNKFDYDGTRTESKVSLDNNNDGNPETIVTYTPNNDGTYNRFVEVDRDSDGVIDFQEIINGIKGDFHEIHFMAADPKKYNN